MNPKRKYADRHRVAVRLPGAAGQHLPGRSQAATLTGGAYRVSVWLPDRGRAATSPTSRRRASATTPVNTTWANGGTRGRERRRHQPDRSLEATTRGLMQDTKDRPKDRPRLPKRAWGRTLVAFMWHVRAPVDRVSLRPM
jgi:hypothetical protein